MVNSCIVNGCKRESYPGCALSFHRIPTDSRRDLWIAALELDNVPKSACVCSLHFNYDDYVTAAKVKLKPSAVPSVLLKLSSENKNNRSSENVETVSAALTTSASEDETEIMSPNDSEDVDLSTDEESPSKKFEQKQICIQTQGVAKTPTILKLRAGEDLRSLRREIKILKQRLRRRDAKIKNLKSILKEVRSRGEDYAEYLEFDD